MDEFWQDRLQRRQQIETMLADEELQARKMRVAFETLQHEYEDACRERDALKASNGPSKDDARSLDVVSLQQENVHLRDELAESRESYALLRRRYEEDRENWSKFRKWWDEALAARQGRKSSVKKPKLSKQEWRLIGEAGLNTPSTSKSSNAEPLARVAQTAARSPVTPLAQISRAPTSLLSEDPLRMRTWLDHVDQRPPFSSSSAVGTSEDSRPAAQPQRPSRDWQASPRSDSKRRRLSSENHRERVERTPLADVSANSSPEVSRCDPPRIGNNAKYAPSMTRAIKAESDDECARDCVVARTQQAHQHPTRELTREELLKKRRAEMEDLKANPWKHRGRGRYAAELQRSNTLANRVIVRPELNGGECFEHTSVVRDRNTRKRMHAYDCACCKDYWNLVGAPTTEADTTMGRSGGGTMRTQARRSMPRGRGGGSSTADVVAIESDDEAEHTATQLRRGLPADGDGDAFAERQRQRLRDLAVMEEEREQERLAADRRQRAGRHRAWGRPAATPEGFWEISFPDTPRREQINDSARKQRQQKMLQMAEDPRYRAGD